MVEVFDFVIVINSADYSSFIEKSQDLIRKRQAPLILLRHWAYEQLLPQLCEAFDYSAVDNYSLKSFANIIEVLGAIEQAIASLEVD